MTLQDGVAIFQSVINNIIRLPIDAWNGLSIFNMIEYSMFVGVIFWFTARMINNKMNEASVHVDDNSGDWGTNPEYIEGINYQDAYHDKDEGAQTTLERAGGWQ